MNKDHLILLLLMLVQTLYISCNRWSVSNLSEEDGDKDVASAVCYE